MSNSKKIDDAPFNLDDYISGEGKDPYKFYGFGREWEMTHVEDLDAWSLLDGADQGDAKATVALLEMAFGEEQFAEFRKSGKLPQRALNELFGRYRKFCGLDEGESAASAHS